MKIKANLNRHNCTNVRITPYSGIMHGPWTGNVHTREFFLCIASHLNVDGMNSFTVDILISMLMRSFNLNMSTVYYSQSMRKIVSLTPLIHCSLHFI
ncbi:hypothetical protein C0J52_06375 [Blattella germanica]|nr:hypothetical protein C0J52_06375 [Blattella germanica]